jgi:carboxyl-terminal processing protease
MKLKFAFIFFITGLIIFLGFSCKKDVIAVDPQVKFNSDLKEWMYSKMSLYYYWNNTLPSFNTVKDEQDPALFFKKLIYTEEDRWSWLTDDYAALIAEFNGTPTSTGISPVFGKFEGSARVFIVIAYIYPNSPAERSGLKRGDIILGINDQDLDTSNYSALFYQSSFTARLGIYNGNSISPSENRISVTSEIIDSNPIVFDTVFEFYGHKIGYIVYVEFISGENEYLVKKFGSIMDEFKNQGVTDLIMDLRYNPGGEISAANYLASCIAPASTVASKQVFVKFSYNSRWENYFIDYETINSPNLVNKFENYGHNLDLNRVFFLTGQHTASASELLMIGLEPYMDVIQIGDTTYGKYTGARVLSDSAKHNWAIVPIVLKYSNSQDFTNFKYGLYPKYLIQDHLLQAKAFGDISDPMLGQAVEIITGLPAVSRKSVKPEMKYSLLIDHKESIKYNLFLNKPENILNGPQ